MLIIPLHWKVFAVRDIVRKVFMLNKVDLMDIRQYILKFRQAMELIQTKKIFD